MDLTFSRITLYLHLIDSLFSLLVLLQHDFLVLLHLSNLDFSFLGDFFEYALQINPRQIGFI